MINFKPPAVTLYIGVKADGTIVNDNDTCRLGPVFTLAETKKCVDKNNTVENYALHMGYNGYPQGAFDIKECQLLNASAFARMYCEKHGISVASRNWVERTYWHNIYEVVDTNGTEYHFHLSREYKSNGAFTDWEWVYVSICSEEDGIVLGSNVTNIRDI